MNTLKYKGYTGIVGYSEEDEVFFGKIEGINSLVNFEADNVKALKEAFVEAVDAYLEYCEKEGIAPDKAYSGTLNIRISPETHRRIALYASSTGTTINTFINKAVEEKVNVMVPYK